MSKLYLSTREVAEMLGVSDQCIRNWINSGIIKAYQFNPRGRILIRLSDIDDAFERGRLAMSDESSEDE